MRKNNKIISLTLVLIICLLPILDNLALASSIGTTEEYLFKNNQSKIEDNIDNVDLDILIDEAKNFSIKNNKKYDFKLVATLLKLGMDKEEIESKQYIHKANFGHKEKPKNTISNFLLEKDMPYIEDVKKYNMDKFISSPNDAESSIYNLLALDLLGVERDYSTTVEKIENAIKNKIIKGHLIGDALLVISDKDPSINLVEIIDNLVGEDYFAGNIEDQATLLETLIHIGEYDSILFKNMFKKLLECRREDGYSTTPGNSWKQYETENHALRVYVSLRDKELVYFDNNQDDEHPELINTPFEYIEEAGKIIITGYKNEKELPKYLVIPDKIGNTLVKEIGDGAFENKRSIKKVEIPSTVTKIGKQAFRNAGLEEIVLKEGLEEIGDNAFGGNSIEEVSLPSSLKNLPSKDSNQAIFKANKVSSNSWIGNKLVKIKSKKDHEVGSLFGIINPVEVEIKFQDKDGKDLKDKIIAVGRENKVVKEVIETTTNEWGISESKKIIKVVDGSEDYLLNYNLDTNISYDNLAKNLDILKGNYFKIGEEYEFEAPEINGIKPENKKVILDEKSKEIIFIYDDQKVEDPKEATKLELYFPGNEQITPLTDGDKQIIKYRVFNYKGDELKGHKVNFTSSDDNALKFNFLDTFTAGKVEDITEVIVTATLKSNPTITSQIKVKVYPEKAIGTKVNLEEEIEFLKSVYAAKLDKKMENSALLSKHETCAARMVGLSIQDIQKNMYIDKKNESAFQLAQSIVTLIGADINPREYNDEGKIRNLVKELEDMQLETGEFASTEREKNNLLFQLRSIIALDMAGGNYNEEKAIKKAIEVFNRREDPEVINNKLLEAESIMLIALSNHREKENVNETIDQIYTVLKENQNDDGGFTMRNATSDGVNTPLAIGRIIQGLIANGINPLEDEEWIKNGNTMLDAMVRSKIVANKLESSGYGRGENEKHPYSEATGIAFAALLDLKNNESIFKKLSLDKEDLDKEDEELIITYKGDKTINLGKDLRAEIKVDNRGKKDESVTLIMGLYNKDDNKLINYSIASKIIKAEDDLNLAVGFLIPDEGDYYAKVFVWDSLDKQNILMDEPKELLSINN